MLSLLSIFAFKDSQGGLIQSTTTLPFLVFALIYFCGCHLKKKFKKIPSESGRLLLHDMDLRKYDGKPTNSFLRKVSDVISDLLCDYSTLFWSLRKYGRNQKTNVTLKFKRAGTILAFVGSIYYLGITCMEHAARLLQPVQLAKCGYTIQEHS